MALMRTLAETLAQIRAHTAKARAHLAKVDEMLEAEELVELEDDLAERGLALESVESEPITLRDSEYAYVEG
ncbi:MAG TPA: hypothetical protein VGK73_28760 [Polyangiaceae bacterium]